MIKVENKMLILDSAATKQDVDAINEFVNLAKEEERARIIKIINDYGSEDFTSELIAAIKEE